MAMAMQQEVAAGESYVGMVCAARAFASHQDPASHCAGIVPELLASVADEGGQCGPFVAGWAADGVRALPGWRPDIVRLITARHLQAR